MNKAVHTLLDMIDEHDSRKKSLEQHAQAPIKSVQEHTAPIREVNVSVRTTHYKIFEHPAPNIYIWNVDRHSPKMRMPLHLEPAYAGHPSYKK